MRSVPALVLASASPRRSQLLQALGIPFECRPSPVDESPRPDEAPEDYVQRLSQLKATSARAKPGELILAADTVVVLDGQLLGKPKNRQDAKRMLRSLAGRAHRVLSGVCLRECSSERLVGGVEESRVFLRPLSEHEISWYTSTGEPDDKAGSYALQGLGALFVHRIEGNSSSVIGLPLPLLYDLFHQLDYDLKELCETA